MGDYMKLTDAFWIVLVCLVVLGGAFVVAYYADETVPTCNSPYIEVSGQCCQDLNYNYVCDAQELQAFHESRNRLKDIKLYQMQDELNRLKSDDDYYKNNFEAEQERHIEDDFTIKVRVRDDETDKEIEDAHIRLVNEDDEEDYYETDLTNDEGIAKFRDVEDDCYEVRVRHDDYVTRTRDYCFDESDTVTIYLEQN